MENSGLNSQMIHENERRPGLGVYVFICLFIFMNMYRYVCNANVYIDICSYIYAHMFMQIYMNFLNVNHENERRPGLGM
jgi:hypothetical protein